MRPPIVCFDCSRYSSTKLGSLCSANEATGREALMPSYSPRLIVLKNEGAEGDIFLDSARSNFATGDP